MTTDCNRRRFLLNSGILGTAALTSAAIPHVTLAAAAKPDRTPFHGLKVGIASYTLRKYPLDQCLTLTQEAGVKFICLKDVHLPFNSTTAERQDAHRKIAAAGLTLLGGGVIYMDNKPDEIRGKFEYARDAGMPTLVCSPDPAALDTVEKMAKEFNLRVAIHNHGPGDKRYPSSWDVFQLIKDRDPLMGICMDIGHTVRLGEDPVELIQKCASRLYDFHIKDVTKAAPKGGATEAGRGVIDLVAILRLLVKMNFSYHVALEYEANGDAPVPGMTESFGYLRGVLDSLDNNDNSGPAPGTKSR